MKQVRPRYAVDRTGLVKARTHHLLLHSGTLLEVALADAELLHLLELVHPEDAPRVLAVRAGLLAEARRNSPVPAAQHTKI